MKKYLIIACASLIALVSCVKEKSTEEFLKPNDGAVLAFTSAKPQLTPDTKTAWDGTTVVWSAADKIRVAYTVDGEWMGKAAATGDNSAKFYASEEVVIDPSNSNIGTFNVPVGDNSFTDPEAEGDYIFYALYPSTAASATIDDVEALTIAVPTQQTPEAGSFQGSADILVGRTKTLTLQGIPTDPIEINWTRLVAHADLTFSNIAFDGEETINSITLVANDAAKLTGNISIDLAAGTASEGSSNTIIIDGKNLTANGSNVEAWVSVLPVTFTSLNVEILTNKAKYTRAISGFSKTFKQNSRNRLTINMSTAGRMEVEPDEYIEYTSSLVEGDYIVYYNGNALKAAVSSNRMQNEAVTPTDGVIATNNASIIWHIAPAATDGYYTFYNAETGKYLAATGSNNQAQLLASGTDDKALFSVTLTDGKFDFVNKANSRYLRQNGTNGWAMYSNSTGGALTLYSKDTRTALSAPASVSAAINSSDDSVIDVTFSTVSGAASYIIIATPESGDPVKKAGVSASPASISVVDGLDYSTTYTISVVAVPSNTTTYKNSAPASASGTVTTGVAPENPEGYELISTLNELETGSYIIAGKTGTQYYALPSISTGKIAGSAVSVSNGFIAAADGGSYVVTITKNAQGQVAIGDGTNYLVIKASGTDFGTSTSATYHTVAVTDGVFAISNTRYLAWRGSTYLQFGNYASISGEYSGVYLFKYNRVPKSNPEMTVTPASPIALEVGETQQLTLGTNSDGAVSYESSDDAVATVTSSGLIEAIAAGSATITVKTAATDAYYEGTKTVTVNVTNGPSSIADVISASANTSVYTAGIVAQTNQKGFIITDGTDNILVYQNAVPTVAVGQAVTILGTRSAYNNVPQISTPTIETGATGQPVTRTTLTTISSSNATGFTSSQYVSLTGALTNTGNYYNVSISGSETQGSLYSISPSASYTGGTLASLVGKMVTVTGYVAGSTDSYLNIAVVDITIDPNAPELSISPATSVANPASWPADNDDPKTFTVTATNGTWAITNNGISSWANVQTLGNVITVTPNDKQASEAHNGIIVVTLTPSNSGYESQTTAIYLSQEEYVDPSLTRDHVATIKFGNTYTNINSQSVTGADSEGNTWTVSTTGTSSFTPQPNYSQIGSSKNPATSITFTTTLSNSAIIKAMSAKFGGFSGTAGTVTLKVGDTTIGTGSLNATNDVTVNATTTNAQGTVLTVTVTGISKGVKAYEINVTYNN